MNTPPTTTGHLWADIVAAFVVGYNFLSGDLAPITVISAVLACAYYVVQMVKMARED
jgi:hypothetical protein